jgi:uncharacterized protein
MSACRKVKELQYVVKISKYCNLRCAYCYEYDELGDKRRLSLAHLRRLFEAAARHAAAEGHGCVSFVWHGGEPFLIPLEDYEQIHRMQRDIFGDRIPFWNAVQTNLTVLTDRHITCLKEGQVFNGIGVSFDVLGDMRVDTKGRLRTETILGNMQRLIDNGISFGAIAVLARATLPHARDIYNFYDSLGVESRLLPYYMSTNGAQVSDHALTYDEITGALKAIFDTWMISQRATPVDPVSEYLDYAMAHLAGAPKNIYNKLTDEFVLFVNTDGGVWGLSEAYDAQYRYGNILDEEIATILASPNRARAVRQAEERMLSHCADCPYFGHCPGSFVGDATLEQQQLLAEAGCPVRNVLDHMVGRLIEYGVPEMVAHATGLPLGKATKAEAPCLTGS